jgi:hypothetical protein
LIKTSTKLTLVNNQKSSLATTINDWPRGERFRTLSVQKAIYQRTISTSLCKQSWRTASNINSFGTEDTHLLDVPASEASDPS